MAGRQPRATAIGRFVSSVHLRYNLYNRFVSLFTNTEGFSVFTFCTRLQISPQGIWRKVMSKLHKLLDGRLFSGGYTAISTGDLRPLV